MTEQDAREQLRQMASALGARVVFPDDDTDELAEAIAARVVARLSRSDPLSFDPDVTASPAPEPFASGPTIVKAPFSRGELARIDAARGRTGRSDWARSRVLAVVRAGREVPALATTAGRDPAFVNFRLSGPDLAALDAARGAVSRSAYIRCALLSASP